MIFVDNGGNHDATLNLALEEYILRKFKSDTDYLLFYINSPSIIIGRNQNTLEEINQKYCKEHHIQIVRRVSGGGAVYHDFGNLNFSFITNHDSKSLSNFEKFTTPVVKVLKQMGLDASLRGRNDLEIDGKKISGTAQFSNSKRMISHGTLLFNADLSEVANALNVKMSKIQSKGHKSARSRVANIVDFLERPMTMEVFRSTLLNGLAAENEEFSVYQLTEEEWKDVRQFREEKYNTWEWNYGKSPRFNVQRVERFPIGEIDIRIWVEKGHIDEFKIYGDFFGFRPIEDFEQLMVGLRYELDDIKKAIGNIELKDYFGNVDKEDFVELIYGEDGELGYKDIIYPDKDSAHSTI